MLAEALEAWDKYAETLALEDLTRALILSIEVLDNDDKQENGEPNE